MGPFRDYLNDIVIVAIFFCREISRCTGAYMLVDLVVKNGVINSFRDYLESSGTNHYSTRKHTLSA